MTKKMYWYGSNRHGKAGVLIDALEARGWEQAKPKDADVIFVDSDSDHKFIADHKHKKIMMYPHAGRVNLINDFDNYPISPYITCGFVNTESHITVQRTIGITYPLEVIGWYLCPVREFQPRESYRKVLFAPIHPNADHALSNVDKELNQEAYKKLAYLVAADEIDLTVRYIDTLEANGIVKFESLNINYHQAKPEIDTVEIEHTDIVIAHQTFAHLGVALGVPALMMGEDIPPRIGSEKKKDYQIAKHWEEYKQIIQYPLDFLKPDWQNMLQHAAVCYFCEDAVKKWKQAMIGEMFNPDYFVSCVEKYL